MAGCYLLNHLRTSATLRFLDLRHFHDDWNAHSEALTYRNRLPPFETGERCNHLRTHVIGQKISACLVELLERNYRVALRQNGLRDIGCALCDYNESDAVFPSLQRDLANTVDNRCRPFVLRAQECPFRDNGVGLFQHDTHSLSEILVFSSNFKNDFEEPPCVLENPRRVRHVRKLEERH